MEKSLSVAEDHLQDVFWGKKKRYDVVLKLELYSDCISSMGSDKLLGHNCASFKNLIIVKRKNGK